MICPIETPDLDDIREAMSEAGGYGADTRNGLAGFWPGRHRGQKLFDFSGNANTGTWSGTGSHWASDGERQGIVPSFAGTNDYVSLGTLSQYPCLNGAIEATVSLWALSDQADSVRGVFGSYTIADGRLYWGQNGTVWDAGIGANPWGVNHTGTRAAVVQGAWTHIVVSLSAGTATMYVDSVPTITKPYTTITIDSALPLGCVWLNNVFSWYWDGKIDDARIYERPLSAAEIRFIYDCGRVAPLSDLVEPVGWDVGGVAGGVVPWHLFGRVA